jgi:hypothetical protein
MQHMISLWNPPPFHNRLKAQAEDRIYLVVWQRRAVISHHSSLCRLLQEREWKRKSKSRTYTGVNREVTSKDCVTITQQPPPINSDNWFVLNDWFCYTWRPFTASGNISSFISILFLFRHQWCARSNFERNPKHCEQYQFRCWML